MILFTGKRSTTENMIARLRFTEPLSGLTSQLKKKGQSANRDSRTPKNMRSLYNFPVVCRLAEGFWFAGLIDELNRPVGVYGDGKFDRL